MVDSATMPPAAPAPPLPPPPPSWNAPTYSTKFPEASVGASSPSAARSSSALTSSPAANRSASAATSSRGPTSYRRRSG